MQGHIEFSPTRRPSGTSVYKAPYRGLYCVGCEQFYAPEELIGGRCPEHETVPDVIEEENWFFRLSRYRDRLEELIESGRLRILPEFHAREVLAFVGGGLHDFSVSRSQSRARGWGIPVPGDPEQVIYVWWDALGNYINALDYGEGGGAYRKWWLESDRRVHVIGKGVLRFHAVYWPAMLLSAGEPLPTTILVHEYPTTSGRKISKSAGNALHPAEVSARYGVDALRWWLLRDVLSTADTDFTVERLVARANQDLANGVGNLVNRTVGMVHRYCGGLVPSSGPGALREHVQPLPDRVDAALAVYDSRSALAAVLAVVDAANRLINQARPWELYRESCVDELESLLASLVWCCRAIAAELGPFVPGLAARVRTQLGSNGPLPPAQPVYPRLVPAHGGVLRGPQHALPATAIPGRDQSSTGSPSKTGPEGSMLAPSPGRG